MASEWGTVCVGIISSMSALTACWMANKAAQTRLDKQVELERQREWQKSRIVKAEEIYSALIKFDAMMFSTHMNWVSLAKGESTLEEITESLKSRPENDSALMKARLGVYFPHLLNDFNEVLNSAKPANKCLFSLTSGKKISEPERKEFIKTIFDSNEKFSKGISELLKKLSQEVAEI